MGSEMCIRDRAKKTGRQATFSSDILYDTLLKYDPEHLMMQITREEAKRGLVDFSRIEDMMRRTQGQIDHVRTARITPLAAPLFLEVGRVPIKGLAEERLLEEEAERVLSIAGVTDAQKTTKQRIPT